MPCRAGPEAHFGNAELPKNYNACDLSRIPNSRRTKIDVIPLMTEESNPGKTFQRAISDSLASLS